MGIETGETLTGSPIEAMETPEQLPRQLQLPPMLEELDSAYSKP